MTDNIIGYRGECDSCPALSFAENLNFVKRWAAEHSSNHARHKVTVTSTREYVGPIVHHDNV